MVTGLSAPPMEIPILRPWILAVWMSALKSATVCTGTRCGQRIEVSAAFNYDMMYGPRCSLCWITFELVNAWLGACVYVCMWGRLCLMAKGHFPCCKHPSTHIITQKTHFSALLYATRTCRRKADLARGISKGEGDLHHVVVERHVGDADVRR